MLCSLVGLGEAFLDSRDPDDIAIYQIIGAEGAELRKIEREEAAYEIGEAVRKVLGG